MKRYVYTIYQVSVKEDFAFMDWKRIEHFNLKWSFKPYKIEWGGFEYAKDDCDLLEHLFTKFNLRRPYGFTGHSMSVSDIVKINTGKYEDTAKYYYCDAIGWRDITKEIR